MFDWYCTFSYFILYKFELKKFLLPLFPTMKLTFGPNLKGPSEWWLIKFLKVILSITPMSPAL